MKRLLVRAASLAALIACCTLASAAVSAETWAELSKKMRDECAVFSKNVADMTMKMEMDVPSSDGPMRTASVLYRKGNLFRVEATIGSAGDAAIDSTLAGLTTVVIADGMDAWIIAPMIGKSRIPLAEGLKYRGQWTCADYIPRDAQMLGSETVNGRACYVLGVSDAGSDVAKLWIDQKSHVLVRLEGKPSEGETMIALFSDFETIPGVGELPHRSDMYSGKDLISTVVVQSIEVNKGLSDDLFDPDKVKIQGGAMEGVLKQAVDSIEKRRDD